MKYFLIAFLCLILILEISSQSVESEAKSKPRKPTPSGPSKNKPGKRPPKFRSHKHVNATNAIESSADDVYVVKNFHDILGEVLTVFTPSTTSSTSYKLYIKMSLSALLAFQSTECETYSTDFFDLPALSSSSTPFDTVRMECHSSTSSLSSVQSANPMSYLSFDFFTVDSSECDNWDCSLQSDTNFCDIKESTNSLFYMLPQDGYFPEQFFQKEQLVNSAVPFYGLYNTISEDTTLSSESADGLGASPTLVTYAGYVVANGVLVPQTFLNSDQKIENADYPQPTKGWAWGETAYMNLGPTAWFVSTDQENDIFMAGIEVSAFTNSEVVTENNDQEKAMYDFTWFTSLFFSSFAVAVMMIFLMIGLGVGSGYLVTKVIKKYNNDELPSVSLLMSSSLPTLPIVSTFIKSSSDHDATTSASPSSHSATSSKKKKSKGKKFMPSMSAFQAKQLLEDERRLLSNSSHATAAIDAEANNHATNNNNNNNEAFDYRNTRVVIMNPPPAPFKYEYDVTDNNNDTNTAVKTTTTSGASSSMTSKDKVTANTNRKPRVQFKYQTPQSNEIIHYRVALEGL